MRQSLWAWSFLCGLLYFAVGLAHAWDSAVREHGGYSMPIPDLVAASNAGTSVLYIDTREPEEFAESHIPGAINIPLRDAGEADIQLLAGNKYVVPYCLKDLRAFEVARTLMSGGLSNVRMLEPSGLRGWQAQGLPVASPKLSEAAAQESLRKVAREKGWASQKEITAEAARETP